MKKIILITLLMLLAMLFAAVDASAAEKENTAVVKTVFEALKTRDMLILDKQMAPEPAKQMKHWLNGFIEQLTDFKISVDDIFASGDNVAARWTLSGKKDRTIGEDWTIHFVCIFRVVDRKVTDMWLGEDMQREMKRLGFRTLPPAPKNLEGKLDATMSDIHVIGRAIAKYMEDNDQAPKAGTIKEVAKLIQPFYIKTCPLEDAWGNDLIYKIDPKNPKNYWIASPGSDGKFDGFDQEGSWSPCSENGQDIVLYRGDFQYCPKKK
jgi:ketosteroid isomerase-like protein